MSRGFSNSGSGNGFRGLRDYGATSSTSGLLGGPSTMNAAGSDVTFAGFSPTEFMSLSENIGQNINAVKTSWQQLEKILKTIGGPKDSAALRDKAHQIQSSANAKIVTTKKDLQKLTVVVRHGFDKKQKLRVERLTSDFQEVVGLYSTCQQQIAAKLKGILLVNDAQQDDIDQDASGSNKDTDYLFHQKQKTMQKTLEYEQTILKKREDQMRQVEEDILDVNQIMKELNQMVNDQGANIDSIAEGIDGAANDVESGQSQLQKAAEYQAKYRRKLAILLIIAVIIGLIVTGVVVSTLRR